jgi:hypothetical protein
MSKVKHSKYKNTGIIFELLVRQITEETMSDGSTTAVAILKKHFHKNSTLLREYNIYRSITKQKYDDKLSAQMFIETCVERYNGINKSHLRREKYNLVKEIKSTYNTEEFFNSKITNYRDLASIYIMLENNGSPSLITNTKLTIIESIVTPKAEPVTEAKHAVEEEYGKMDEVSKKLTYKILIEKFNSKYSTLNSEQKSLLREYIESVTNSPRLKQYINESIEKVQSELDVMTEKVTDPVVKIKITEVRNLIKPLCKKSTVHDDNVVNLLNYYELVEELRSIHN